MSSLQDQGGRTLTPEVRRIGPKVIIGTGVGNTLEWFDWGIYATFATYISVQFFDSKNPTSALLATLAVFGAGFLARPAGGWLFGWLADRVGRKLVMTLVVASSAAGSLLIGLTPNFETIGVWASVILLFARILQGLAHGGELPTAQAYISEMAPNDHRGLWSSLIYISGTIGTLLGVLCGVILTTTLSADAMADYGWRIPFILGGVLGLYALVLRRQMTESVAFEKADAQDEPKPRVLQEIVRHRKQAAQVVGLTAGITVFSYAWAVSIPAYAISTLGVAPTPALIANLAAGSIFIALLPLWGKISDRIGRKPVLLIGVVGAVVLLFPMDALLNSSALNLFVAMTVLYVFMSASSSILPAVYSELFPTRVRAVGIAIPYSIAVALFGGTAPFLQTWMGEQFGRPAFISYLIALLVISGIVITSLPETKGQELR
ncbi:MFS transporter [Streptomyces acidicola]|uniref:MFS transporter n=1 Tax=Streptomyces acidicola TaxID=2596892 RepID=UPI0037FA73A7